MNKLITFIIATFVLAASAFAKIGETREQVIARSQRNKDIIAVRADEQEPMLYVHYRDGALVVHVFGVNGLELAMLSYTPKRLTGKDITEIQRLYPTRWHSTGLNKWESQNGLGMIIEHWRSCDFLAIGDTSKEKEINSYAAHFEQQNARKAVPVAPEIAEDKKDCLIVATEMRARLRGSAQWSRIAAFSWKVGAKRYGHAVVFYQPDANSNVFFYDGDFGSIDLGTQSRELPELIGALNELYDAGAQNPRWIGGN